MDSMIYNPLEEYVQKFKGAHLENTNAFFDGLVKQSGIDIEANRETVRLYNECTEGLRKLKRKYNWLRFWRVLMCITILLIPLVILKITPKIKVLRQEIEEADKRANELLEKAKEQMAPLNRLFSDKDCIDLFEKTVPMTRFDSNFSAKREEDMRINYDFSPEGSGEESTLDVMSGEYNENPFVFENKLIHTMGTETYHGYKTIHWTETVVDSNGKTRRVSKSETLHATVTKPKPFYSTQVVLNYGAQSGPELCFSRDATNLHKKSEQAIERYVKRGEKRLKRKTDKAIRENDDFVSMSNTDFEVLFDALDRTDEVQFRTLFSPLAQTNMTQLILSKEGYGDDFNFFKRCRMNKIITTHSQGRMMYVPAAKYTSYSFDTIKENFTGLNAEFFKAVYFDFASLWAIPSYQERPVNSLKPIPDFSRLYAQKECESLANRIEKSQVVHPDTKTNAILKSTFAYSDGRTDTITVNAFSYDIEQRIEIVSVWGGDGRMHNVDVHWDDYIPLNANNSFAVCEYASAQNESVLAAKNGLCIFKTN